MAISVFALKLPLPLPIKTETELSYGFDETISRIPSPLTSPAQPTEYDAQDTYNLH